MANSLLNTSYTDWNTVQLFGTMANPYYYNGNLTSGHNYLKKDQYIRPGRTIQLPVSVAPVVNRTKITDDDITSGVSTSIPTNPRQDKTIPFSFKELISSADVFSAMTDSFLYSQGDERLKYLAQMSIPYCDKMQSFCSEEILKGSRYFIGDPGDQISNDVVMDLRAKMQNIDIPIYDMALIFDNITLNRYISSITGAYQFTGVSSDILKYGNFDATMVSGIARIVASNILRSHISGTAKNNVNLEIGAIVESGAQSVIIDQLVVGETIKVGDIINLPAVGEFYKLVAQNDRLSRVIDSPSVRFQVAAWPASLPNTDWDSVTQTYTATSAVMQVQLSEYTIPFMSSTDQGRWLQGNDSDIIAATTPITILGDFQVGFATTPNYTFFGFLPFLRDTSRYNTLEVANLSLSSLAEKYLPKGAIADKSLLNAVQSTCFKGGVVTNTGTSLDFSEHLGLASYQGASTIEGGRHAIIIGAIPS